MNTAWRNHLVVIMDLLLLRRLWLGFLQSHAATGTLAWGIRHDVGVHRADVASVRRLGIARRGVVLGRRRSVFRRQDPARVCDLPFLRLPARWMRGRDRDETALARGTG